MEKKLVGNVALITGASGGFGNAIAKKFAENGCELVLTYRSNIKKIEKLSKILEDIKCKFSIVKADISKDKDRKKIKTDF